MNENNIEDQTSVGRFGSRSHRGDKNVSRLTTKERGDRIFAYLLNVPSVILILALIAYPVVVSLWTSLHRYNLRRPEDHAFIGLGNYVDVLTSYDFWHSLRVTLYFGGMSVALVIVVAISIAVLFNEQFRGRGLARALLLIPWAVPGIVNGLMWAGLFGEHGAFNQMIGDFVNLFNQLTGAEIEYLGMASPFVALNAAIAAHVWRSVPFACIIFLAALQAIPGEQYRAGTSGWRERMASFPTHHPAVAAAPNYDCRDH